MGAPQIIYICLASASLLMSAYKHGKAKTGTESIWTSIIATAISTGLLIWGGFFI